MTYRSLVLGGTCPFPVPRAAKRPGYCVGRLPPAKLAGDAVDTPCAVRSTRAQRARPLQYAVLAPRRRSHSGSGEAERGVALASTLMAMVVLLVLGAAAISTTTLELRMSGSHRSSLQAFYAAEAGLHTGVSQLSANRETSAQAIPVTGIGGDNTYQYRSGRQHDAGPQPLEFVGTRPMAGYSVGNGTGYNPAGYVLYTYQITTTGIGPSNAQRELTALGGYGPVAQ